MANPSPSLRPPLQEILRQDQKASLAALEAILKEKEPGPAPGWAVAKAAGGGVPQQKRPRCRD